MDNTLQGNLKSFRLPEILTFLNMGEKTGTLHLFHDKKELRIFFDRGAVVFATSNEEKFRLAAVLVRKKKITEENWKRLEGLMLQQGEKFGKVAVAEEILTEKELQKYLKLQVSEIIFGGFEWDEGKFHFTDGLELPDFAVTISIDLTNLVMECTRRIDEWTYFSAQFPSDQIVFRLAANMEAQKKINLSLEEWKILFLINGKRTLEQICSESTDDPLDVYRVVYGLFVNRLLEIVESPAEAAQGWTTLATEGDDTSLLLSPDATLSYQDVLKVTLARLTLTEPGIQSRTVPLISDQYLIGRQMGTDIHISDPSISSVHARIFKGPEGYFLEDLNSRNGTFLNGTRIDRKLLKDKDSIQIGSTNLVYNIVYEVKPLSGMPDQVPVSPS